MAWVAKLYERHLSLSSLTSAQIFFLRRRSRSAEPFRGQKFTLYQWAEEIGKTKALTPTKRSRQQRKTTKGV